MHDPLIVAFTIVRPWPQRSGLPAANNGKRWAVRLHHVHYDDCAAEGCTGNPFPWWRLRSYGRFWRLAGREYYWPPLVTIWHREPGGADALSVCRQRWQDKNGQWHLSRGWRWHVRHWHIQFHPAQNFRRWALTRCEWCGGRSRKGDPVNISRQWDGPRGRWWRGEPGLFHQDCSSVEHAHRMCLCADPLLAHGDYGKCLTCGRFRSWRQVPGEADRLLASLPEGSRIPAEMRPQVEAAWAARRERSPDVA